MLADFLNNIRDDAIDEIEQRANTIEGPGLPSLGRTQRLNALFDEVLTALRSGGVDRQAPLQASTIHSALESEERELVRQYVVEVIERQQLEASPTERGSCRNGFSARNCVESAKRTTGCAPCWTPSTKAL